MMIACIIARDAVSNAAERKACLKEADPALPEFLFGNR